MTRFSQNIIDSDGARAYWISRAHTLITICMELSNDLSWAMAAHPSQAQAERIAAADQQLGAAVASLGEAAAKVRGLS